MEEFENLVEIPETTNSRFQIYQLIDIASENLANSESHENGALFMIQILTPALVRYLSTFQNYAEFNTKLLLNERLKDLGRLADLLENKIHKNLGQSKKLDDFDWKSIRYRSSEQKSNEDICETTEKNSLFKKVLIYGYKIYGYLRICYDEA